MTGDEIVNLLKRPDVQIAEYFIAIHGPGALWQCREALGHLDPPSRWAGLKPAVGFVRSLGFSAEWAGEPNTKPPEYLEVEGPYTLPELHDYQRAIVSNVRSMLRTAGVDRPQRRGMISMPTGSGKTRVAVQAVVEAMRDDGFDGGVLWVADREELCEQAVEVWRQVWSSIGTRATPLRISRLWGDQPRPQPTSSGHVVVATIQTLNVRLKKTPDEYEFLADFTLIVFDEAHRSVAPTFTSVMQEIGLTRWQRSNEPFLLGLTATPYRGRDAGETRRLVNRYGHNRLDAGAFASDDPRAVIAELPCAHRCGAPQRTRRPIKSRGRRHETRRATKDSERFPARTDQGSRELQRISRGIRRTQDPRHHRCSASVQPESLLSDGRKRLARREERR
jgi:hypothetical protein